MVQEQRKITSQMSKVQETARKPVRKIGEILKYPPFHPEILMMKSLVVDLLENNFIILDAKVVEDFHSQFKTGPTTQILGCLDPQAEESYFRTISSHQAIVGKIQKLIKANAFPVEVRVIQVNGGSHDGYYDFADDK